MREGKGVRREGSGADSRCVLTGRGASGFVVEGPAVEDLTPFDEPIDCFEGKGSETFAFLVRLGPAATSTARPFPLVLSDKLPARNASSLLCFASWKALRSDIWAPGAAVDGGGAIWEPAESQGEWEEPWWVGILSVWAGRIEREVWSAGRNWCSSGRARTYAFWYRIRETLQAIGSLRAKRLSGTRLEARSPFDALVEAGAEGRRIQLSKPPFVVPSPATCFRQRERKFGYAILRGKLT